MIIKGEPIADIGADHAKLAVYLLKNRLIPWAIVTDVSEEPYRRALVTIADNSCQNKVQARKGDGLQVLAEGEVGSIIIAGMGADNIVSILSYDWRKSNSFKRYIFQPMSRVQVLRSFLALKGWPILDERLVRVKNRYFVVLSSMPGQSPYSLSPLEREIGPVVLRSNCQYKKEYLRAIYEKYRFLLNNIGHSQRYSQEDKVKRLEPYRKIIAELEEILYEGDG